MLTGGPDEEPALGRFAPGGHRFPVRVFLEDVSGGEHVYNGAYLRFVERARMAMFQLAEALSAETGRQPYERYQVIAIELRLLRPALLHDVLVVTTCLTKAGRSSCTLDHSVARRDEVVATAAVTLVFTSAEGQPTEQPRGWMDTYESLTAG